MDMLHIILLVGVGLAAGFINVLAGGGSLLTLPVLILTGLDAPTANGANRIALLAQNASATAGFHRNGYSDVRLSLTLSLAALPGTVAGALLGLHFSGPWFNRALAVLMIGILLLMARRRPPPTSPSPAAGQAPGQPRNLVAGHLLIALTGFYTGLLQAGVGFALMAILNRVMGMDLIRVNMHKVFIIGVTSIAALIVFAAGGKVAWAAGLWLALGNAVGGWIGSHVAVRRGEPLIRLAFNIAIVALAVRLLFTA